MGNELVAEGNETVLTPYKPAAEPWQWNNKKNMHEWTQNEVKDYMTSLTYTETTRNVMKNKITGKDLLLCRSPQQIAEKIGISLEKAEGIYEMLQLQKQEEMYGANKSKKELLKDRNSNFLGSRSWKRKAVIHWTPYNVKSWFVSEFSRKIDGTMKKQVLDVIDEVVLNGDRISNVDDGKVLAGIFNIDIKIGEMIYSAIEKQMLSKGSTGNDDEKKEKEVYRFRTLPWRKYEWIKLSKKTDCIMGYNDKDGIDRAEMPCGHAIAADTMFYFIKSIIEKNKNAVFIICPVSGCETEWDWNSCLRIGDMNEDEVLKYNVIRENRKPKTIITKKACPFCQEPTTRPNVLSNYRVSCNKCKKGDWCFGCEQKWLNDGKILCGNSNCKLVSGINDILQNCATKEVEYLDCKIPIYRACPKCLTPIEHLPGCKHMDCQAKNCGTSFCFICLAVKDKSTGWPKSCNEGVDNEKTGKTSYRYQCKFAPRQYFV